jgi:hypothetical protein
MKKRFIFSVLAGLLLLASGALAEYSKIEYTGDGTTHVYGATFTSGYMDKSTVRAHVEGESGLNGDPVYRTLTWPTSSTIDIGTPPADGLTVTVERVTSSTVLKHTYQNGSVITAKQLNDSNKQHLYLHQELKDVVDSIPEVDIQVEVAEAAASAETALAAETMSLAYLNESAALFQTGTLPDTRVAFTDNTTNNASSTKHGFAPKGVPGGYWKSDWTVGYVSRNASGMPQTINAGAATNITGSVVQLSVAPSAGVRITWVVYLTKTAAGTATSAINVQAGVAGTVADTDIGQVVIPTGTAAADEACITVTFVLRPIDTGMWYGTTTMQLTHNLASTGFATVPTVVTRYSGIPVFLDTGDAGQYFSLNILAGASNAFTIISTSAELTVL